MCQLPLTHDNFHQDPYHVRQPAMTMNTMKKMELIIRNKRFPYNGDFIYELVIGTVIYSGLVGSIMSISIDKLFIENSFPKFVWLILPIPIFAFWYLKQNVLQTIPSHYPRSINHDIVRKCLQTLKWEFSEHQGIVHTGSKPFILRWVYVRIIPIDNEILYSFQYSEGKGFRPLFFFGIKTYLKWQFSKQLRTEMLEHC